MSHDSIAGQPPSIFKLMTQVMKAAKFAIVFCLQEEQMALVTLISETRDQKSNRTNFNLVQILFKRKYLSRGRW